MKNYIRAVTFVLSAGLPIFLLSPLISVPAQATEWRIGVVDGSNGGRYSSLRLDANGDAHVGYFSPARNELDYSFWDHSVKKWFTTTLDRSSGGCSLVLDSGQRPHISYIEYGTGKLKYAHWDGSTWKLQALSIPATIISYYTSIALDSKDNPSISFYEEVGLRLEGRDGRRLRIITWNGNRWELRTVDADEGSGKFNSIASDSTGHPQVAYGNVQYENASLRYAHWNGRSWQVEILEGAGMPGTSMWSVAMITDNGDVPHLVYTDVKNQLVKYASKKDGKWNIQVVDSLMKVGYPDRNGIALDDQGNPYVSYFDAGAGLLKVAHKKDEKWVADVIDENFAGFNSCLQISGGKIWLTYSDESGEQLKFAYGSP